MSNALHNPWHFPAYHVLSFSNYVAHVQADRNFTSIVVSISWERCSGGHVWNHPRTCCLQSRASHRRLETERCESFHRPIRRNLPNVLATPFQPIYYFSSSIFFTHRRADGRLLPSGDVARTNWRRSEKWSINGQANRTKASLASLQNPNEWINEKPFLFSDALRQTVRRCLQMKDCRQKILSNMVPHARLPV